MNRNKTVSLTVAAAAALALGFSVPAFADGTPASGSAVISESNSFVTQSALAGIVSVPLPSATASYSSSTGLSGTFPVTGGNASLTLAFGSIQLGGSLLLVDARTLKSVTFSRLALDIDTFQITGVPQGSSTAVPLLDPAGDITIDVNGAVQTLAASDLDVDPAGATYLDAQLHTSFFTPGQSVGSLTVNFTPAS
ncbi:hypothetical protein [Streptacidiphilus cavernicola]|uniref:Choice-of-anchor E domain-containing protein n=1 Tax=Streptacidiphilus cavernicola TaxID=3342716 RepID=A0ABV6VU66_9ACTN